MPSAIGSESGGSVGSQGLIDRRLEAEREAEQLRLQAAARAAALREREQARQAKLSSFDGAPTRLSDSGSTHGTVTAASSSRALLEGGVQHRLDGETHTLVVEDALPVNTIGDRNPVLSSQLAMQVADNERLEQAELARLSPDDRARYLDVRDVIANDGPDGETDQGALLALQTSLLEGRLPGEKTIMSGQSTLDGLHELTTQKLAPGIDRYALLTDVTQEVTVPEAVAQQTKGTCVATAIEIQLIMKNPAEYVRLVAGLASPERAVTTAGADRLEVQHTALADSSFRSVSQRLLAPALMELGNGARLNYRNGPDGNFTPSGKDLGGGLDMFGAERLLQTLYNRDFGSAGVSETNTPDLLLNWVKNEADAGRPTLVGLQWGDPPNDGGHKVLVTGTRETGGKSYVELTNPWGRVELMEADEFKRRLHNVNFAPDAP
ncbi:MAG: hypothetical protein IPJ65_06725 [Archangiaceae bacterium]|nr:hypothetical protein [Archangiaceae bacterium]